MALRAAPTTLLAKSSTAALLVAYWGWVKGLVPEAEEPAGTVNRQLICKLRLCPGLLPSVAAKGLQV